MERVVYLLTKYQEMAQEISRKIGNKEFRAKDLERNNSGPEMSKLVRYGFIKIVRQEKETIQIKSTKKHQEELRCYKFFNRKGEEITEKEYYEQNNTLRLVYYVPNPNFGTDLIDLDVKYYVYTLNPDYRNIVCDIKTEILNNFNETKGHHSKNFSLVIQDILKIEEKGKLHRYY